VYWVLSCHLTIGYTVSMSGQESIIDSSYTSLEEAVRGTEASAEICDSLALVDVEYLSFDGFVHAGQIVVHKDLVADVKELFASLLSMQFPIQSAVPILAYGWDDEKSMLANNSSAFCYRPVMGTDRLSNHSYGRALDINPLLNPYFAKDGNIYPAGATYNPLVPGTIASNDAVVALFREKGWEWGGDWEAVKDYQHFQKLDP